MEGEREYVKMESSLSECIDLSKWVKNGFEIDLISIEVWIGDLNE